MMVTQVSRKPRGNTMIDRAKRRAEITTFLLAETPRHPRDLVRVACAKFAISRQALHRYLGDLISAGQLVATGKTRQREYHLRGVRTRRSR